MTTFLSPALSNCYDTPMRILGIDYGTRRLGLALSDPLGITAQPFSTMERTSKKREVEKLKEIISEYEVEQIVIGLPTGMNGSPGKLWDEVQQYITLLERTLGLEIHGWDERLTTTEAERMLIGADVSRKRRREVTDKIAAAIMLQAYLDAHYSNKPS